MNRCLSTLAELDEEGFSPGALDRLSDRRKFPTRLDFTRSDIAAISAETMEHISISGVQQKLSLRLERGELKPTGEGGQYILKPVPETSLPRLQEDVPANEHLTMQIARQVYDIETAANACIRLKDGELAYITRRFDRTSDDERIAQEDFCQLMGRTEETHGKQFKYDASYETLGQALRSYCGAYLIEAEKLFCRIVFNYAVANGDAHLKNVSLTETTFGDYVLTPAYDLMCTKLHLPNESRLALDLFDGDERPASFQTHGFVTGADLIELARRFGLDEKRATSILDDLCGKRDEVDSLVERSFLSEGAKQTYREILQDRLRALEIRTTS
ncbi:MAG: type II toxin-antitoxin system HipA family toxin [Bradymonadaceae bacterium]